MKQLFLSVSDGSVSLEETPAPAARDNMVVIETLYSVISAGTERSLASFGEKNLLQKALERPDQLKKVAEKISTDGLAAAAGAAFGKLKEPMPMGYSAVGRVVETGRGVPGLSAGDIVAAAGNAYHSEVIRIGKNLAVKVPDGVGDIRQAAFCALGGIALEGIHQAEVIPGETVAVIGLGLLGHITARILSAYGCDVIGFDVADRKRPQTRLKAFIRSGDGHAADMTRTLTGGRGADKAIITAAAQSNAPVALAQEIVRDRGILCMVGVTKMELDRRIFYEKELCFKIARSYGPGRYDSSYEEEGTDYPAGYVRFTEGRNIEEFLRLLASGRLDLSDLITHVFPFEQAGAAYEMITKNPHREPYAGVLLQYGQDGAKWDSVINRQHPAAAGTGARIKNAALIKAAARIKNAAPAGTGPARAAGSAAGKRNAAESWSAGQVSLGLIGAGMFARSTMLPEMRDSGLYHFRGLAATGGPASAQAGKMFPFDYVANDCRKLLEDAGIDMIAVSTQHDSHARLIIQALEAGKHVYAEKPLCLTLEELDRIGQAYEKSPGELFCGLNRRHSPLVRQIRKELQTDKTPAVYEYTVNAGHLPPGHWTQDEKKGGGRIIGEAVHFIDTLQALDGSGLAGMDICFADAAAYPGRDNALITLKFRSGAAGTVLYTSMGSRKYPKEQLRVFSGGAVYELDNYVALHKYGSSRHSTVKLRQDKGMAAEYRYMHDVLHGRRRNDSIRDALEAHRMLLERLGK